MRGVFPLKYLGIKEFTKKTGEEVQLHVFYDDDEAEAIKVYLDGEAINQVKKLNVNDEIKADIKIKAYQGRISYTLYQLQPVSAARAAS